MTQPSPNDDAASKEPAHLQMAIPFGRHFGIDCSSIPRDKIDAYLIAIGYMPVEASRWERNGLRNECAKQVCSASKSPSMREIGLASCGPAYR